MHRAGFFIIEIGTILRNISSCAWREPSQNEFPRLNFPGWKTTRLTSIETFCGTDDKNMAVLKTYLATKTSQFRAMLLEKPSLSRRNTWPSTSCWWNLVLMDTQFDHNKTGANSCGCMKAGCCSRCRNSLI